MTIFCIKGVVQEYSWGRVEDSIIPTLAGGLTSESGKFAEYWLGTHVNGTAEITSGPNSGNLLEVIKKNGSEILGELVLERYGTQLPFLFKILSVGEALSIQTHPDTEFAKELHVKDPEHYKDPFPKPEVGIAIEPVQILYGFRPLDQLSQFLQPDSERYVPELKEIIGDDVASRICKGDSESLKEGYNNVMRAPAERCNEQCQKLYERLAQQSASNEGRQVLTLAELYPKGDPGIFSVYLLNLVTVPKDKALYIGPNIPHAYLYGELVECMAPSDNVVRAGLTPKFVDTETLLYMLDYTPREPELISITETNTPGYYEYPVPLSEYFRIGKISSTDIDVQIKPNNKPELLFTLSDHVEIYSDDKQYSLSKGEALLVSANTDHYSVKKGCGELFRVSVP